MTLSTIDSIFLKNAIDKLSEKHRKFLLLFLKGFSLREIGDKFGIINASDIMASIVEEIRNQDIIERK